jgi:uncharacterized protein YcbK (DUF882 family)
MSRRFLVPTACLAVALCAGFLSAAPSASDGQALVRHGAPEGSPADVPLRSLIRLSDDARGRSGALRVAVVHPASSLDMALAPASPVPQGVTYRWTPLYGTRPEPLGGELYLSAGLHAPAVPGIWRLRLKRGIEEEELEELTVVTTVPASLDRSGRLNGYHIGTYPAAALGRTGSYAPPQGFIEVTPANRDMQISQHFRLGEFLTKDQFDVWPKYLAVDLRLIDKLELTMQELKLMGVRADRMHIMSGFRTPQYNGPGEGGRALLSRHTYGDAADVWVEVGSRRGYIADLNGDGRRDTNDAFVILEAVERVEQRFPELVGGIGVYREKGARGPFVHIDVRGVRSRW